MPDHLLNQPPQWTTVRQLFFLRAIEEGGTPAEAAAIVGMSRESAYRLARREPRGLFALTWDYLRRTNGRTGSQKVAPPVTWSAFAAEGKAPWAGHGAG